jgi:hypothetical protein
MALSADQAWLSNMVERSDQMSALRCDRPFENCQRAVLLLLVILAECRAERTYNDKFSALPQLTNKQARLTTRTRPLLHLGRRCAVTSLELV